MSQNTLNTDLEHVLTHTETFWEELKGERIFITGGTGFFGKWFLESFIHANERLNLKAKAVVLSRDASRIKDDAPHLAENSSIEFHHGDVRDFKFPAGAFSHVIHAATTSAEETFRNEPPLSKYETVADGTRRTLEFAAQCKVRKLLLTSTGGAYGPQPGDLAMIPESYNGAPDITRPVSSALGEAKRVAELLTRIYSEKGKYEAKICRCFTFIGPYLQLDIHYAAGNFIRDALRGGPVVVRGDGSAVRSFLYSADLMVWLWTALFKGEAGRLYNVGSEREVSIGELAQLVASRAGVPVVFENNERDLPTSSSPHYVPSVQRITTELGVKELIGLEEAIDRTLSFYRERT
jgi:dTDP-glucose 4,6-dehydratase